MRLRHTAVGIVVLFSSACLMSLDEGLLADGSTKSDSGQQQDDQWGTAESSALDLPALPGDALAPWDAPPLLPDAPPLLPDAPPLLPDTQPPPPDTQPPPPDTQPPPPDTQPPPPDTQPPPPDLWPPPLDLWPLDSWPLDSCSITLYAFASIEDAEVRESAPSTNYGGIPVMSVDGAPLRQIFLKFEIKGLTGTVVNSSLRLFIVDSTANGPALHATSNAWQEMSITWDNKPAPWDGALYDMGAVSTGWVSIPLGPGSGVGNGTYSLVLVPTSSNGMDFESREGTNPPRLRIATVSCP